MTENEIGLKAISELLGMNFFIPSYQRGYRWDKQQIDELLDDIYAFAIKEKDKNKEFYCLQPIVVKQLKNKEKFINNLEPEQDWYEVIDGQQRLTTIRIILSYLENKGKINLKDDYGKPNFTIEYQTRPNTKEFLDVISTQEVDNLDCYFIKQSHYSVTSWFENTERFPQPKAVRDKLLNTFVLSKENVSEQGLAKVIWYEIEDDKNPIDTFIRINMGKIPLTNAELIKALFLQDRGHISDSQQTIIANEWDKMEYAFQNEEFWEFLNKNKNDIPARIEFLFDLICEIEKQKDRTKFEKTYGTDKYTTFRFFNDKFKNDMTFKEVWEEWDKIHEYFLAFQEWYNTPKWYHYIGFLIYSKMSIIEIYNLYESKKKEDFTEQLIVKIKETVKNIPCEKSGDNYSIDLSYKNDSKQTEKIRKLLLLFNIEFINKQYDKITTKTNTQDDDNFIIKFPFKLFKSENWDVEHIDSQTPNFDNEKEWLQTAKEDLSEELSNFNNKALSDSMDDFLNNNSTKVNFADLYKEVCKISGEIENDDETKNSIGNLTLLNTDINCSYGNALFATKRRIIIENDMEGKFIPICTKHVFLKYFDKKGTSRTKWGKDDIQNYQNHIGKILGKFLTVKEQ